MFRPPVSRLHERAIDVVLLLSSMVFVVVLACLPLSFTYGACRCDEEVLTRAVSDVCERPARAYDLCFLLSVCLLADVRYTHTRLFAFIRGGR